MSIMKILYENIYKKIFGDPYGELEIDVPAPRNVTKLEMGDSAPNFFLISVDGKYYSLESFLNKKIIVIIFSCNHCPYVKAYENRMIDIQRDYKNKGIQLIAINSNDEKRYPEENLINMKLRAQVKGFNFPYLRDIDQLVARDYGPNRTPEVFVFNENRMLCYHGRIDDNAVDPEKVQRHELRNALDLLLDNREILIKNTNPVGCTLKWKLD